MLFERGLIGRFEGLISKAERAIIHEYEVGEVEDEQSITDRFVECIKVTLEDYTHGNLRFKVRTLGERGPKSPESQYGADICGILMINIEGYQVSKGILIQSKKEKSGINVDVGSRGFPTLVHFYYKPELDRLKGQVAKMMEITPDSFVLVYSSKGFVVTPASSVMGLTGTNSIYGKRVGRFFKEFLLSFVGDSRLSAVDDVTLEKLRRETNSRTVFLLELIKGEKEES